MFNIEAKEKRKKTRVRVTEKIDVWAWHGPTESSLGSLVSVACAPCMSLHATTGRMNRSKCTPVDRKPACDADRIDSSELNHSYHQTDAEATMAVAR